MSGSGWWSAVRRYCGACALPPGDVQGLQACKGHYESTGCENHRPEGFEVQETNFRFTTDVRSKVPLTPADFESPDETQNFHGFLRKEAREIEQHFRNFQAKLKQDIGGTMVGDFAVMHVAQEWRCWVWTSENSMVKWEVPGHKGTVLEKRRALIRRISDTHQNMVGFNEFLQTLQQVDDVLDRILDTWDVYKRLGSQLKSACNAFDRTLLHSIEFSVFAFLGIDVGEAFQPNCLVEADNGSSKLPKKLKKLASTSFGKMLKTFLLDSSLSGIVGTDFEAAVAFPRIARCSMEEKPEHWQKLFVSLGVEGPPCSPAGLFKCGHGFVEASILHFTPDDCCKVLEEMLKLWEATRAVASARHILRELMLSRQAPKQILESALLFALDSLEATQHHFQALQTLDREGAARIGILSCKEDSLTKLQIWEKNRNRAGKAGDKLKQNIQDLEALIQDMKESVSKITSEVDLWVLSYQLSEFRNSLGKELSVKPEFQPVSPGPTVVHLDQDVSSDDSWPIDLEYAAMGGPSNCSRCNFLNLLLVVLPCAMLLAPELALLIGPAPDFA